MKWSESSMYVCMCMWHCSTYNYHVDFRYSAKWLKEVLSSWQIRCWQHWWINVDEKWIKTHYEIYECERRITVKVLFLLPFGFLLFNFAIVKNVVGNPTQSFLILSSIDQVLYYFVLYSNTFNYKHTISLTTFDKLCEKQRPSGFSDKYIPIHYYYFCRLRSQSKIII